MPETKEKVKRFFVTGRGRAGHGTFLENFMTASLRIW